MLSGHIHIMWPGAIHSYLDFSYNRDRLHSKLPEMYISTSFSIHKFHLKSDNASPLFPVIQPPFLPLSVIYLYILLTGLYVHVVCVKSATCAMVYEDEKGTQVVIL